MLSYAKTFIEKKDSLGRRVCFRDGVHVPCPGDGDVADDSRTSDEPDAAALTPEAIAEGLERYPTADLQALLRRLGGKPSPLRQFVVEDIVDLLLMGAEPIPPDAMPDAEHEVGPPVDEDGRPHARSTLASRVANLVGKPLSREQEARYTAVLSGMTVPQLRALREEVTGVGSDPEHQWGCLMAVVPPSVARAVVAWSSRYVPDGVLAQGGREDHPHVTIAFGFEDTPGVFPQIRQMLQDVGPFRVKLTAFDSFPDGGDGTVLMVPAESDALHTLHDRFADMTPGESHPEYKPHMTVAYVEPDVIDDFVGTSDADFLDTEFIIDTLEYSPPSGPKQTIRLRRQG